MKAFPGSTMRCSNFCWDSDILVMVYEMKGLLVSREVLRLLAAFDQAGFTVYSGWVALRGSTDVL
jgi:hypothetical protein